MVKQLQGKRKTNALMEEFFVHNERVERLMSKRKRNGIDVDNEKRIVKKSLTDKALQFKTERINKKVQRVIERVNETRSIYICSQFRKFLQRNYVFQDL